MTRSIEFPLRLDLATQRLDSARTFLDFVTSALDLVRPGLHFARTLLRPATLNFTEILATSHPDDATSLPTVASSLTFCMRRPQHVKELDSTRRKLFDQYRHLFARNEELAVCVKNVFAEGHDLCV